MSQLNAKAYVPLSALRMYQRKNFIFPVENRAGIKFFARIPDPLQGTSGDAILEDDLLEIISKAEKSQGLGGLVLYKGSGARTKYLVTGWVAPEHWTKLLSHLNSRINEHGRLVGYGKTVTSLSAGIGPVERGEQLIGPGQHAGVAGFEPMPATELLNFDESQILEFQGFCLHRY